jgi:hypothetical protein
MPTSGTGSLETLTFRLKAARVGYSGAMHDGGQQKAHSIGGDMLLASLHQLAAVKAALPPYMRRFVSRPSAVLWLNEIGIGLAWLICGKRSASPYIRSARTGA